MNKTYVIAEIGINHNGDLTTALDMIIEAKKAGANAVKFQKRTPELCVPKDKWDDMRDTPSGPMKYIDYKKSIEFSEADYHAINEMCKKAYISWSASVWDIPSLRFIDSFNKAYVPFIKIPSALLTDSELLLESCKSDKALILSIGMSTLEEVNKAIAILKANNKKFTLLHCNSSYPSKENELDLSYISELKRLYPNDIIGYSGHEIGYLPTLIAVSQGAEVIERHVTLNKESWGTDHKASLEFSEFRQMIKDIRRVEQMLGVPELILYPDEIKNRDKLRTIK